MGYSWLDRRPAAYGIVMKKVRALIVDDSSVMRKIVERALRQAGLDLGEVLEASNGAEGLAEVQKGGVISLSSAAAILLANLRLASQE